MAKLRKIKSGSALSPPDNRTIAQKPMRSRYIRTVKRKRKKVVLTIPVTTKNSSHNTTFVPETSNHNHIRPEPKADNKARIPAESIRYYDTSSYAGGRKFAEKRHKKRLAERSRLTDRSISTAVAARTLNTSLLNAAQQRTGENGKPDEYAESQISYAGRRMTHRSATAIRSVGRQRQSNLKGRLSASILSRWQSISDVYHDVPVNSGIGILPHGEISVRQGMRLATEQYRQERRIEHVKTGIFGMLQSVRKAIKAIAEASKSTAAAISIAGIGSTVVLVIVSVVLVLAMTISSSFGEYGLELSDNDLVNIALSQVGTESGEEYCKWYGFDHEVGWCAIFVSWCGTEAGLVKKGLMPKFAWVPTGVYWFQSRGQWHPNDYTPKPGDIIFFDWYDYDLDEEGEEIGQDGQADHVGIVEKVEGGRVYTVEGNTTVDGICAEKHYPSGYFEILGYGEILYP